ncbi:MAG: hypothetical protein Q9192_003902 [Flavoplaca navasiana]
MSMTTISADQNPHEYEKEHVHEVYEQIASHFSSTRYKAIAAILETLRPASRPEQSQANPKHVGGKALIYVWALEQKTSRRGWDEGDNQDVMVPWVMKTESTQLRNENTSTFHRYYHLYRHGELEQDIIEAGGHVVESGYEKDNWWAIAVPKRIEA